VRESAIRAESAKKKEEMRRAESAKKKEEMRRVESAKKKEEMRRVESARRAESAKKKEEMRRAESAKKKEEMRRVESARRAESAKKKEEMRRAESTRRAESAKMKQGGSPRQSTSRTSPLSPRTPPQKKSPRAFFTPSSLKFTDTERAAVYGRKGNSQKMFAEIERQKMLCRQRGAVYNPITKQCSYKTPAKVFSGCRTDCAKIGKKCGPRGQCIKL
jgi:hypothetical protein